MERGWPKVRCTIRFRRDLGPEPLVLATADVRERSTVGTGRGGFVQIHGDLQFIGDPLSDGTSDCDTIVHGNARDGDEGEHVDSPHPRMFASMTIHVDQLHGLLRTSERCLGDTGAIADEGDDGPVVVRIHLLIEDSDLGHGADGLRDRIDDILAAALREIGDALDDLRHGGPAEATNVRVH